MESVARYPLSMPFHASRELLAESVERRWPGSAARGEFGALRWTLHLAEHRVTFVLFAELGATSRLVLMTDLTEAPADAMAVLNEVSAATSATLAAPPPPPVPVPAPEPEPEPRQPKELGVRQPPEAEWADVGDFAWVEWAARDVCVALVHGRAPEEVLRKLSNEAVTVLMPAAEARAWAEEQDWQRYGTSLEAGRLGDWTLVVEQNGYQASDVGMLAPLSRGTAVAVACSSGALMVFHWAVDGRIVRWFDALVDLAPPSAGDPLPQEAGLPFRTADHSRAAMYALLQRLTGVHLTEQHLTEPADRIGLGVHPG